MSGGSYKPKGILYEDIPPLPPDWVRVEDHKERWEKLRCEARAEAEWLAMYLSERWNVKRVWLYGSVAGTWLFTEWSDIDLAVEGLNLEEHFRAWRDLEQVARTKFPVDLRRREEWSDQYWNRLIPRPVLLFERR